MTESRFKRVMNFMGRQLKDLLKFFVSVVIILSLFSMFVSADINSDLVSYWSFDTDATDSIGSNNGAVNGAVQTTGFISNGYSFDGVDDEIVISDDDSLSFTDGSDLPFSVNAWINFDDVTSSNILSKSNTQREWGFRVTGTNHLLFTVSNLGSSSDRMHIETGDISSLEGSWHMVTGTYDGSETASGLKIYIDGVYQYTTPTFVGYSGMTATSEDAKIGGVWGGGGALDGIVDEVGLFGKELIQSEIDLIYNSGNGAQPPYSTGSSCTEDWQTNYNSCEFGDRRLKYYIDSNDCETFDDLPADNNIYVYDCDFCVENWEENYYACETNDYQTKYYIDSAGCFDNYDEYYDLPLDNGTLFSCNYCSQDLSFITDECLFNGTGFFAYQEYIDNNYYSCCAITGIYSDCDILDSPYNESGVLECAGYSEDFEIEYDDDILFGLSPEDRVYWKVFINRTNATSDYDCISYVKNMQNGIVKSTVQINPATTKRSERTFPMRVKYDDREFFSTQNNIGSVYFTREDLIFDNRAYLFGVECVNDDERLISERVVYPNYESIHTPQTILLWARNNTLALTIGFLILLILALFMGVAYRHYLNVR